MIDWRGRLKRTEQRARKAVRGWLRFLAVAARHGVHEIRRDKAHQIAAALTFYTLFSLLPTLALVLVISRTFVGDAEQDQIKEFIVQLTVNWLEGGGESAAGAAAAEVETEFQATLARVDESVHNLLNRLQGIDFQSIGVVGVGVFLYAAQGLLATIEESFNQIYGATRSRPLSVRLPIYFTTLALAPLVIILGHILQNQMLSSIVGRSWLEWLAAPVSLSLPLFTTWLVFTTVYVLIPNTYVSLRTAAAGGFIAAIGSVTLNELFGFYIGIYAGKSLYGSLALMPLALMWLWFNWIIVLFGLEVSKALQTAPDPSDWESRAADVEWRDLADGRWLAALLVEARSAFHEGRALSIEAAAHRLRAPTPMVRALADVLVERGFFHEVRKRSETDPASYTLARAPEDILLNDVFDLWRRAAHQVFELDAPPPDLEKIEARRRDAFEGVTLASLVEPEPPGSMRLRPVQP